MVLMRAYNRWCYCLGHSIESKMDVWAGELVISMNCMHSSFTTASCKLSAWGHTSVFMCRSSSNLLLLLSMKNTFIFTITNP